MTTIQITVINIDPPVFTKTTKGGYNAVEVAYKKDGKVEGKKILDFVNKDIYAKVQNMQPGKTYDIEIAKDKNDYWQWISINETTGTVGTTVEHTGVEKAESGPSSTAIARGFGLGRVTGSNYETPEERARKQVLIGRQSSVNYALDFLKHNNPKGQFALNQLFDIAEQINSWVVDGDPTKAIAAMQDDIPV